MLLTHRPDTPEQAPVRGWRRLLDAPLTDLRIGLRLGIAFGGVLVLMAAMAVFATMNLAQSNQRMTHIVEGNSRQSLLVSQMIDSVAQRSIAIRNRALLTDPGLKDTERQTIAGAARDYTVAETELLAVIARFDASEAEKTLLEAIKRSETAAVALMQEAEAMAAEGRTEDTVAFLMD
jgi:methyl-accepting chemotaxis protein